MAALIAESQQAVTSGLLSYCDGRNHLLLGCTWRYWSATEAVKTTLQQVASRANPALSIALVVSWLSISWLTWTATDDLLISGLSSWYFLFYHATYVNVQSFRFGVYQKPTADRCVSGNVLSAGSARSIVKWLKRFATTIPVSWSFICYNPALSFLSSYPSIISKLSHNKRDGRSKRRPFARVHN